MWSLLVFGITLFLELGGAGFVFDWIILALVEMTVGFFRWDSATFALGLGCNNYSSCMCLILELALNGLSL